MSPNASLRKRRKEDRPAELMAAALDLFVEKGFAGTRLEDVAQRAGVSKGTLYLYFDSKEALFNNVIQEGVIPVLVEGEGIAARHQGSAFELLEKLLTNWWAGIGETGFAGIPKLIVAEARNFPDMARFYYENVIRRGRALIGSALQRGMDSGEFARRDVETTVDLVIAPILMLLILRHAMADGQNGQDNPQHYIALHLDLLRTGLKGSQL
jgi:AcrR family transcriptional regulator